MARLLLILKTMERKKILLISIIVLLVIFSGYYFYSHRNNAAPTNNNPFFGNGGNTVTVDEQREDINAGFTPGSGAPLPSLYELHKTPVAGIGFTETGKGATRVVSARYVDKSLGNVYETPLSTLTEKRIVNDTRASISQASWINNSKTVVMRSLGNPDQDMIVTRIINISDSPQKSTDNGEAFLKTDEVSLPEFIPFIATSEDSSGKIFYLENTGASSLGYTTNSKGVKTKIFESPITEWIPQFPKQSLVTLTTRPSESVPGYMFFFNTGTKSMTKILSGINGLTTLTSKDGNYILYSETVNGVVNTSVYNVSKKTSTPLSIHTLPEKCAWSSKETHIAYCGVPQNAPRGSYPDVWYQGLVSFNDEIVKVNVKTNTPETVFSPTSKLDIINPTLTSDDSYIGFINKASETPLVYKLK